MTAPAETVLGLAIETKSASQSAAGGVMDSSEDGYEHTLILSATGIVDSVNDVPVPGLYARTLRERMPKQIKGHNWDAAQGTYLWMKELMPGDPGLPKVTPQGKPWPAEAGALIGRVKLFKGVQEGEEARKRWKQYGPDLQLSIGYSTKKATRDPRTGRRFLHDVDLYENSEVLWGSSPISGPLPAGLAVKVLQGVALEAKGGDHAIASGEVGEVDVAALHLAADPEIDWDEVAQAAEDAPDDADLSPAPDDTEPEPAEDDDAGEPAEDDAAGDENEAPAGTETLSADVLADAADLGVEVKRKFTAEQREHAAEAGAAMHDGSYPIENADDLANAIQACGRAKDTDKARQHIISRARALGLVAKLPESWNVETKAAAKPAPKKVPTEQSQNSNSDFNSKHPRGGKGSPQGGKFVKKGSGSSDGNNDGLPDDWQQQLMKADPRYAANAAKKGRGGKGKGKGKGGAAKKGREKQKAAGQATRAAEMKRRDEVETRFEQDRAEEDARRAAHDQALSETTDRKVRAGMVTAESARRRDWQADWRARRAEEAQIRRAWEADQRQQRIEAASKTKSAAAVLDVDQPHTYFPTEDGTGCDECDLSAVTEGAHTDPASTLAAFAWAEDQAWLDAIGEHDLAKAHPGFEGKAEGGADQNRGNAERLRRWYLDEAGIPWGTEGDWAACVALASKHMRPDQAKGYCNLRHKDATGDYAGPKAHGGKAAEPDVETKETVVLLDTWTPDAEVGPAAAWIPTEVKRQGVDAEAIAGTLEERRERVRAAVHDLLKPPRTTTREKDDDSQLPAPQGTSVYLVATFKDRAIAERCTWDDGRDERETFEVPYSIAPDGAVLLGDPKPVVIRARIEEAPIARPGDAAEPPEEYAHPVAALVEDAAYAMKALTPATETKAGRVLSGANENRLRQAITHLLAVCGVAGVTVDFPTGTQIEDEARRTTNEPLIAPDTTSQLARVEGKAAPGNVLLSHADIAAAMAVCLPLEP